MIFAILIGLLILYTIIDVCLIYPRSIRKCDFDIACCTFFGNPLKYLPLSFTISSIGGIVVIISWILSILYFNNLSSEQLESCKDLAFWLTLK